MSVSTRPGSRPMQAPFTTASNVFNTANSMGRLTLNMLLSFAQFEREVTAERIRDKIAASKAKGMWMGGIVPLGYKAFGRTLTFVEEHAALIRDLFRVYSRIGNVRLLKEQLNDDGVKVPERFLPRPGARWAASRSPADRSTRSSPTRFTSA